jgi:hypothetical protein
MFTLDHVVPWGRSHDEYCRMFTLSDTDLSRTILGCGDGPASFNAEATRRGTAVVSCDPLYQFNVSQIRERIAQTYDEVIAQTRRNEAEFVWTDIRSVEELGRLRMSAMNEFLEDFERGTVDGRYVDAALPSLPFADGSFDLALCSHFLFLYTTQLGEGFHQLAIRELCRVAREVRVFPLLALGGKRSPLVDAAIGDLRRTGFASSIEKVPYEFQLGGNEMMRIRTPRTS